MERGRDLLEMAGFVPSSGWVWKGKKLGPSRSVDGYSMRKTLVKMNGGGGSGKKLAFAFGGGSELGKAFTSEFSRGGYEVK